MKLLLSIFLLSITCLSAKPINLKCDYRSDPIAVEPEAVRFFWKNDSDSQKAYHLLVSDDNNFEKENIVWDSGVQVSSKSIQIAYQGSRLEYAKRYYWKVGVLNQDNKWTWSDGSSFFETIIDPKEGWNDASWISCDRDDTTSGIIPDGWLGDWVSTKTQDGLIYEFFLPEGKQFTYAGAYYSLKYLQAVEIKVNDQKCDYATNKFFGYVDFGFNVRPGKNRIEVDFKGAAVDQALAFGMKILDADGNVQWIRSGKQWKSASGAPCELRTDLKEQPKVYHTRQKIVPAWYKNEIDLNEDIQSARLYFAGVGYAEAYINGQQLSDHGLEKGQSDYEAFTYYQTKDVTKALRSGANVVSFLLADGWYNQDRGFCTDTLRYGKPALIANLVISYKDGTQQNLTTGKEWKWATGALQHSNIYVGEEVDFRKIRSDQFSPGYSAEWNRATVRSPISPLLKAQDFEPVRKINEIQPVNSWKTGNKTWIFDFGRNLAGGVKLKFNEPAGTEIRIRMTESFDRDKKQLENVPLSFWWCHSAPQNHLIIADGKERIWEPQFTYQCFQFLEITGVSSKPEIVATDVYSDVKQTGFFNSSDALLNQIYDMGVQTHYMNMHSILEDCPQREKCLWGGDLHASWATGYHTLDSAAFYRQQSRVFYTGDLTPEGVPGSVGVGKRINNILTDFSWGVSPLFVTYRNYQIYGDLSTFEEHYDGILNYLQFFEKDSPELIPHRAAHGDHAAPEEIKRNPQNKQLIAAINFFAACKRFSEMAKKIGKNDDAEYADNLANRIKSSVNDKFLNRELGSYGNATHDSLALTMGVVPDVDLDRVKNSLAQYYRKNDKRFDGGFMSYAIYPWLSELGESELAYDMLTSSDYPGVAWSIKYHQATSMWEFYGYYSEEWKLAILPDRSRAHHAMNHPTAWMLNHIAGIQHDESGEPGMQNFILKPVFLNALQFAEGSSETLYGTIRSRWERQNDGELVWNFTVPPNCSAKVIIESGMKMYEAGEYELRI